MLTGEGDEKAWIRHRIAQLREVLKLVNDQRAQEALESLIAEARERLAMLEARKPK